MHSVVLLSSLLSTLLSTLLGLAASRALLAQETPPVAVPPSAPLAPGQRVRVHVGGERHDVRYVGDIASLTRDSLTLRLDPPLSLPVSSIRRIERSRGATARGLLLGLFIGGAAGGVVGWQYGGTRDTTKSCGFLGGTCYDSRRSKQLLWARVGAGLGAVPGALLGKELYPERWQEMPLAPSLGWRPDGRPALVLSLRLRAP